MRLVFLLDYPGVVYSFEDSETDTALQGVVQVETIWTPENHTGAVLQ